MGKCVLEQYSRVTGFLRPVQQWNKGKTEEFKMRKHYQPFKGNNEEHTTNTDSETSQGN